MSLRKRPPKPRKEEIYFIGACNVPLEALDPALTRPGRLGRHIFFRTPAWEDRRDIFDLYIRKVAHDPELDTRRKRDELARVTSGYSPAMIDQVCSMALTYAHSDGRPHFTWEDIVEAMTTVESGVAIGQEYPPHEERATAIHEAGHAVCSHLYNENLMSTRLSIRKRGSSGGHHRAMEIEERFADWRSEMFGHLIHVLGAMAAEVVFYGQNTTGVGGDVRSVTWLAGRMVGYAAMAPQRVDLSDRIEDPERRAAEEDRVMERFAKLGYRLGDANQLVAIQSGGLEIAGRPLSVALRAAPVGGDIHLLEGHGVMYTLNGLGPNGSIKTGEPSEERHLLLRREAVELTLYTFRYAEDVDMVVTLLPPRPPAKGEPASATPVPPVQALFFRPGDLAGELDVPLAATIPPATPRPETFPKTGPEAQRIETLTGSNLFTATFQQDQDASAFLVLERQG